MSSRGSDEAGRIRLQLPLFNGQQLHSLEVLDYDLVLMRPLKAWIGLLSGGWPVNTGSMNQIGGVNKSLVKVDRELLEWFRERILAVGTTAMMGADGTLVPWQEQIYDLEPIHFRHIVDRMRADHFRLAGCIFYEDLPSNGKVSTLR